MVRRAIEDGVAFLLSRDPAIADYPMPSRDRKPSGYVCDVLQNLEALAEVGHARDPRAAHALEWLVDQQDALGRFTNRYAYNRKTTVDIEPQGRPSKWVTLAPAPFCGPRRSQDEMGTLPLLPAARRSPETSHLAARGDPSLVVRQLRVR